MFKRRARGRAASPANPEATSDPEAGLRPAESVVAANPPLPAPATLPAPQTSPLQTSPEVDTHVIPPSKVGRLCVVVLCARGLAAADKGGTSDPYAVLSVRTGAKEEKPKKTTTKKKTLDPEWEGAEGVLVVDDVMDEASEVVLVVKDEDRLGGFKALAADEVLGQADFVLRDLALPADGSLLRLPPISLHGAADEKQSRRAQGTVELMVGWRPPTVEEFEVHLRRIHGAEMGTRPEVGERSEGGERQAEEGSDDGAGDDDDEEESDEEEADGPPQSEEARVAQRLRRLCPACFFRRASLC